MKPLKQTFIHILLTLVVVVLSQKSTDESRPYEFGFTIDGEQHRHEKKDQNGIVQGEFGFITADGVYHVTVYATDENGKFKILSMRNIRISAPLDGSPATGPISPEAGKYLGKQKQIGNSLVSPPQSPQSPQQPQSPPKQYPQSSGTISQPNQQISPQSPQGPLPLSITTKPKLYEFTTQATIKPACGGCGYVTTSKPINGQPFAFQNPAFQNPPNGLNSPSSSNSEQKPQNLQSGSPGSLQLPVGSQYQQQSDPHRQNELNQQQSNPQNTQAGSNLGQSPGALPVNSQYQNIPNQQNNVGSNLGQSPGALPVNPQQNIPNQQNNVQYPSAVPTQQGTFKQNLQSRGNLLQPLDANFLPPGTSQGVNGQQQGIQGHNGNVPTSDDFALFGNRNAGSNGRIPFPATSSSEVQPNPLTHQNKDVSKLPPVSVTGNSIHVAGNKPVDIPIRDKYPGMVDGLPDGIEEKDIKDILYKFHYTVGFHGHYEKGLKNGAKIGGYFVNGRDGISRVVTYIADENGYRPKFKFINLGLDSSDTPKEGTEKSFGLKSFEFVWYPVE